MSQSYQGNYTNNLYDPRKRYRLNSGGSAYVPGGFSKSVPLSDSELRELGDVSDSFIRQLISNNFPRGSSTNNGFQIVQSASPSNNFTIKGGDGTVNGAGVLFVDGYILFLRGDIEYTSQNSSGSLADDNFTETLIPALTTPGGPRTDIVYVDFYFAEVSAAAGSEYQDSSLLVAGIGTPTANRTRQVQDIRVSEGGSLPSDGPDGNGIYHRYIQIATLNRTATANITSGMIVDNRILINSVNSISQGSGLVSDLILAPTGSGIGTNIGDDAHRISNIFMASTIDCASSLNITKSVSGSPRVVLNAFDTVSDAILDTSTTGNFLIKNNGTTALTIDPLGNVSLAGIGTFTVSGDLQVNGTTTTTNTNIISHTELQVNQTADAVALGVSSLIGTHTVLEITNASSGNALTIDNGNVGIGTVNPQTSLELWSNGNTLNSKFGFNGEIYFNGTSINSAYGINTPYELRLNDAGYHNSNTQFRDTYICDGKHNVITSFAGATGRVGIGTYPGYKLTVVTPGGGDGIACVSPNGALRGLLSASSSGSGFGFAELYDGSNVNQIRLWTQGNSFINGGYVGIGTTNPVSMLEVDQSIDAVSLAVSQTGVSNTSTVMTISNAGTGAALTIDNGNVGIGTDNPSTKLTLQNGLTSGSSNTLQIQSSAGDTLTVGYSDNGVSVTQFEIKTSSLIPVYFQDSDVEIEQNLLVYSGNVSIHTPLSSYQLDCSGTGHFTGNFIVDSNVGIGTATPSTLLDISNPVVDNTVQDMIRIQAALSTADSGGPSLQFRTSSGPGYPTPYTLARVYAVDDSNNVAVSGKLCLAVNHGTGGDSTTVGLQILSTGAVQIPTSVGIGTNPSTQLENWTSSSAVLHSMFGHNGEIYFDGHNINSVYNSATDTAPLGLNFHGYNDTNSNFRNTFIYNGKEGVILKAEGSTGYVGIGTISPETLLEVNNSTVNNTIQDMIRIQSALSTADSGGPSLQFRAGSGPGHPAPYTLARVYAIDDSNNLAVSGSLCLAVNHGTGGDSSTVALQILSTGNVLIPGNVGIGTTNPTSQLENWTSSSALLHSKFGNNGEIYFDGHNINSLYSSSSDVAPLGLNYHGYNDTNSNFRNTFIYDGKEGVILKAEGSTGYVGIGSSNPVHLLDMENGGGGYYSSSDHQWHNGSTAAIKQDISSLSFDPFDILSKVDVKQYRYKTEAAMNENAPYHVGFIAEQTPTLLTGEKQNSMATGDCIGLLLACVKSLSEKVSELSMKLSKQS